jgi:imidazolonepropionase-like amidohydrolase
MMRLIFSVICFMLVSPLLSQVLIKNTNVMDVENKKILAGYDVVALDGKIVSIHKDRMYKLPPGTQVIEGSGKYLIPGLVDAHIHFFQSGGIFARPDAIDLRKFKPYTEEIKWVHDNMDDFLRRYLRIGITSVVDVGSTKNFLMQKDSFANKTYAPFISMTGPLLTTWIPEPYTNLNNDVPFHLMKTEEDTRQAVRDQVKLKADFIKIWYIVMDSNVERGAAKNLTLVKAAIDEAHKNNLRVAVHATERLTAQMSVEAGADFLVHNIEDEIIKDDFIQLLKKKKTVVCPTLIVGTNYGRSFTDSYPFTTDELAIANPVSVASIIDFPFPDTLLGNRYIKGFSSLPMMNRQHTTDSISIANFKKLHQAGVIIATGTDAGNIGTQHAGSYFVELKAMEHAGMSGWELLQASTINGAKAVGKENIWGSLVNGKLANMVLLNANPLEKITNWRNIDWVINKGIATKPDSMIVPTPTMLAQQQLNAYNAHDLEAFLAVYSEDVEVYEFPNVLSYKGKAEMKKNYSFLNNSPTLYCRLLNRVVQGNMVIDHEEILGVPGAPHYGVAIYVIENGKISKVYFPRP